MIIISKKKKKIYLYLFSCWERVVWEQVIWAHLWAVRRWLKIYMHIDKKSKEKRGTCLWIEVPKEQRHLENTLGNQPYWTGELQGRQKSRVSNKKKKYLGSWLSSLHLMHCINWTDCIYEEMTSEQCLHSSQPFLPPPEGSW